MTYAGTATLAIILHIIINYDILIKQKNEEYDSIPASKSYRRLLLSVLVFYVCDALWGFLYDLKVVPLAYADTMIFFAVMAFSVFLWTRFVIAYLDEKSLFIKLLSWGGILFMVFELIIIFLNFFSPVLFSFSEDGIYTAGRQRYVNFYLQLFMFVITSIYMFIKFFRSKDKTKRRHLTIGLFGLVMAISILGQAFDPLLPIYTVGYLICICLLHTFVHEDIKEDRLKELKHLLEVEKRQRIELGSARHKAYTDFLTEVRNKQAYSEEAIKYDEMIINGELKELGIIVFDLNNLKIVNDSLGHDEGDQYIKNACRLICKRFKHSSVFRIGGDEFVALLEGEDYLHRTELLNSFDKTIEENLSKNEVIVSTGLDIYEPEYDRNIESVFKRADMKMYDRKRELKDLEKKMSKPKQ